MREPETHYTKSGDVYVAYQVVGDGPIDLVVAPGFVWHLEHQWEYPEFVEMLGRFSAFARVILFDKRGTGLSDRVPANELPTLEERMDDLRAVLDAVGSERTALVGFWEGGPMCAAFAATYPERTRALVLYGSPATFRRDDDYPWAPEPAAAQATETLLAENWGKGLLRYVLSPSVADDERVARWWSKLERLGASPGAAVALLRMNREIDVRAVLPTIRVPTLVLHRREDSAFPIEAGRYLAERIPQARFVELAGRDHLPWIGDQATLVGEIEEFLTGSRTPTDVDRVLATVLFVDVVGSTTLAHELGDRLWRDRLAAFHAKVREQVARFRGREVDTAGDGFFATFDGPARALRAATAIRDDVRALGLEVRTGVHTGECEVVGAKVAGIAVHVGARVTGLAAPGEVLATSTVRDLVAGSGLEFEDRGEHRLEGVPSPWRLFSLRDR